MELGGDDQWSNIIGGVELLRKKEGKEEMCIRDSCCTAPDGMGVFI